MSEQTKLYPRGRAKAELNRRLCVLASWLQSRVAGEHNANTTLTMLERKTKEIVAAYHSDCDGPEVPTPLSPGAQAIQDGITRGKILRGMIGPSVEQIVLELRGEIEMYIASYREVDGKVRDRGAMKTIACIEEAIRLITLQQNFVNSVSRT